ncbi:MAG: class I SAM-dependent methyltransferase [Thermoanaerobaculales bacterium]|nr:class I SAM-dependent methyltransferase [Thermoanaerobaculales bacterium]
MGAAEWGADPGFFGPRHAHREGRILGSLARIAIAPGPHIECAAGVGSLSMSIAAEGRQVVATDLSLRSLAVIKKHLTDRYQVHLVVADMARLPFRGNTFTSATSAETLEHIPDDLAAVSDLARVLAGGASLVGTVPADPGQWSDWDLWADHQRRYTRLSMEELLRRAGLDPMVRVWGWPILRLYDDLFLKRVNRRRHRSAGTVEQDDTLRRISKIGKRRWLVRAVRLFFSVDYLFDGAKWGVGLLFVGTKSATGDQEVPNAP